MNKLDRQLSRLILLALGAALAMLYLTGCRNTDASSPSIVTPLPSAAPLSNQVQPTITEALHPTATPVSVATIPLPTLTLTQISPALTKDEALGLVVNLQETNGGCELPCWWGITPGETTGQSAKQILSPLRDLMEFSIGYLGGAEARYELQLQEYNNIRAELIMKDEKQPIGEIWVFSFIPDEDQSTHYDKSWQRYFLDELLTRLGMPSDVWLGFGPHIGDHDERPSASIPYYYELYVIYRDLGVIVRYAGPAMRGDPDRACPSLGQLKDMLIFIRQRSRGPLVGPPWDPFTNARTISDVTKLDVEMFYKTFKNSGGKICLESPAKLWP